MSEMSEFSKRAAVTVAIVAGLITLIAGLGYFIDAHDDRYRLSVEYWNNRAAEMQRNKYVLCSGFAEWKTKTALTEPWLEKFCS